MKTARVIGNIWATRKEEKTGGPEASGTPAFKSADDSPIEYPIVAADIIGAGVGEKVIYVGGSSARGAAGGMDIPVDATVVGIVDDQEIEEDLVEGKR